MPYDRADVAMRELIAVFSCLEAVNLIDRLARTAAAVAGTGNAGFVRVDVLRRHACSIHVHTPPGDPLSVRRWLAESGVMKELVASQATVRLARDVSVGEPGFLSMPVPMATRDSTHLWVAGRGFSDGDEHLVSRFAAAAGRALEAAGGLEAAVRMLRGVRSFRPV
ncbi:hypothetical protein [Nonomuraea sp. KM88]|uniref:hypothetical protein n=1 Tax=Nonomuraea sp. KM88 TaxID=3457427 RepID=UPI003FCCB2D9